MAEIITPEALFELISNDNEVIKEFKNHSLRVRYFSTLLAEKVNECDDDLTIAALLHDIGKMGISKEILFKQERLNSIEMTVIQSHCHVGNTIIRKELGNHRAAQFVRDHHENWDGTGYPRGLTGEEISIQGRIIRICDSFDAMTYDKRNYNLNTLSFQEAMEELKRCAWKQFDGNLVEEFIALLKEIESEVSLEKLFIDKGYF